MWQAVQPVCAQLCDRLSSLSVHSYVTGCPACLCTVMWQAVRPVCSQLCDRQSGLSVHSYVTGCPACLFTVMWQAIRPLCSQLCVQAVRPLCSQLCDRLSGLSVHSYVTGCSAFLYSYVTGTQRRWRRGLSEYNDVSYRCDSTKQGALSSASSSRDDRVMCLQSAYPSRGIIPLSFTSCQGRGPIYRSMVKAVSSWRA